MAVQTFFKTAVTDTWTTASDGDPVGTLRLEGNKWYKCVLYDDGTGDLDIVAGDIVYYVTDTGYAASTVTADLTDADTNPVAAGVALATVTATSTWMWIQIKGLSGTLSTAIQSSNDGTPVVCADGDPLVAGDADKTLRRDNTVIDADTERIVKVGWAIDASDKIICCDFPW